jgi:hypothetical protein
MNRVYPKGREGILDGSVDMTGDVRLMLVRDGYAYSDDHKYIADMGIVDNGRSPRLEDTSYVDGVFGAADTRIVALMGAKCSSVVIYQHTGNDSTARLIAYIDESSSGLPCTPATGQAINFRFNNGKIFEL